MKRPLLLDSWVLSTYTTPAFRQRLLAFIDREAFLPLVNALHLVELFNPGWRNARTNERGDRVASVLAESGAAIIDPMVVGRAEFFSYPAPLPSLPLQLRLTDIQPHLRQGALVRFLRADPIFRDQGKDIRAWAAGHRHGKQTWAADRDAILADAVRDRQVAKAKGAYSFVSAESRKAFLDSLDRRLFGWLTPEERQALGESIIPLFLGDTAKLPAVRLSSLLFAYSYIDVPATDRQRHVNSDLADHWHLMVAPYCEAVTADMAMKRVLQRLRAEAGLKCTVYGPAEIKAELA